MKKYLFTPIIFCSLLATARHRGDAKYRIPMKACNNELTVAIPSITSADNIGGIGIGLDYVRYLGKDGIFSLNLGARAAHVQNYVFRRAGDFEDYTDGGAYFLMPGIQCHPFSNHCRVNYAVGLGVPLGVVSRDNHIRTHSFTQTTRTSDGIAGIALTNDVSFISQHHQNFVFGLHLAIGYTIDNSGAESFFQFGIKLGGRF